MRNIRTITLDGYFEVSGDLEKEKWFSQDFKFPSQGMKKELENYDFPKKPLYLL